MKAYDVTCPQCGRLNFSVLLEETDGWMECIACRASVHTEICIDATFENELADNQIPRTAA